jgi:hypothetical protein
MNQKRSKRTPTWQNYPDTLIRTGKEKSGGKYYEMKKKGQILGMLQESKENAIAERKLQENYLKNSYKRND